MLNLLDTAYAGLCGVAGHTVTAVGYGVRKAGELIEYGGNLLLDQKDQALVRIHDRAEARLVQVKAEIGLVDRNGRAIKSA